MAVHNPSFVSASGIASASIGVNHCLEAQNSFPPPTVRTESHVRTGGRRRQGHLPEPKPWAWSASCSNCFSLANSTKPTPPCSMLQLWACCLLPSLAPASVPTQNHFGQLCLDNRPLQGLFFPAHPFTPPAPSPSLCVSPRHLRRSCGSGV